MQCMASTDYSNRRLLSQSAAISKRGSKSPRFHCVLELTCLDVCECVCDYVYKGFSPDVWCLAGAVMLREGKNTQHV